MVVEVSVMPASHIASLERASSLVPDRSSRRRGRRKGECGVKKEMKNKDEGKEKEMYLKAGDKVGEVFTLENVGR